MARLQKIFGVDIVGAKGYIVMVTVAPQPLQHLRQAPAGERAGLQVHVKSCPQVFAALSGSPPGMVVRGASQDIGGQLLAVDPGRMSLDQNVPPQSLRENAVHALRIIDHAQHIHHLRDAHNSLPVQEHRYLLRAEAGAGAFQSRYGGHAG